MESQKSEQAPQKRQQSQWELNAAQSSSSSSSGVGDGLNGDSNYFALPLSTTIINSDECSEQVQRSSPHLFSAGLVADIQYAPIPDGKSYSGTPRYYEHALEVARHAFGHFNQDDGDGCDDDNGTSGHPRAVELVLNLGDTIDGKCQDMPQCDADAAVIAEAGSDPGMYAMSRVLDALSRYTKGPTLHTYGNHCLYNLDRARLGETLGIPFVKEPKVDGDGYELVGYYHHIHKGIRFVVLDSYDICMMQRCPDTSLKRKQAEAILTENNPNYANDDNMNSPEGLEDLEKRFVGFNGAVDQAQLVWLERTLEEARQAGEKAIILSHQPIYPGSSGPVCLMWNYDQVLSVLRSYPDVVVMSLSGHAHKGGYQRDPISGIHFRVVEAVLENKPDKTYAIVDVHQDEVVIHGHGNCQSAVYDFEHTRSGWKSAESQAASTRTSN